MGTCSTGSSLLCHKRVQLGRVRPASPCAVQQELRTSTLTRSSQPVLGHVGILETSLFSGSSLDLCGASQRC